MIQGFHEWPLAANILVFALAAVVIAFAGTRLARVADELADRTGMGEAMMGALFLGAMTSVPGIITSVTAAWQGHASLAVSNAIGGMAAQTVFLAVADFFHRKANLEHAAASVPNMINAALLIGLLALILLVVETPPVAFWGIHPMTPVLFLAYVAGLKLAQLAWDKPQWMPRRTRYTIEDGQQPDVDSGRSMSALWGLFLVTGAITAVSGWLVARTGIEIAGRTGLSETVVGGLFTAVSTSTPELITAVAAVRQKALTLAVGNIIGGNAFDVMFAGAADVAYREGSVYHAIGGGEKFLIALTILMTAVLVLGLLQREKRGVANIGFEGVLTILIYVAGFAVLAATN